MPSQLQAYWNKRWYFERIFYYDNEIIWCDQAPKWGNGEIPYVEYLVLKSTEFFAALFTVQVVFTFIGSLLRKLEEASK